ncbi:MAG: hypothetical protein L7R66_04190 [Candidatus Thalassarchaeaceae archaeon]|nr:hypothetical protein [Candidatus Thalassarchaeaceae archaeon]|tara:strand:- start:3697 stop:4257 length:561 start_codon:yes stop_codon:yes gene_type:complete
MATIPWFPAWGVKFSSPIENISSLIADMEEWRPDERWILISYEVAASEVHLWSAWHQVRRNEQKGTMVARDSGAEFLRVVSGTRQIRVAIERSGISKGDAKAWIIRLPEIDTTKGMEETSIPMEEYNHHSSEAERIIEHLGGRMITRRPFPTIGGLVKIGAITKNETLSNSKIEQAFLLHASMSDL